MPHGLTHDLLQKFYVEYDEILLSNGLNTTAPMELNFGFENHLNHLVYQLYGLKAEEIAIIENSVR
ncbi:MAG: hypothetical protein Q8S18_04810 [Bacteroidales bacterium]|nr:hypothetical protein [Bacteroidales bacterium]